MIKIKQYSKENEKVWDQFIENSKNPLFMFNRKYMEYHEDRFQDNSLMFYDENKLVALLPMNVRNDKLITHEGLTFGGFIESTNVKQHTINDCTSELISYAKGKGIKRIVYKHIPHMYHEQPSEEDIYALFLHGAQISKVEAATVINLRKPLKMPKGRKSQISRAKRESVVVKELNDHDDYCEFINLENRVLSEHYGATATHTGEEMALLHSRFPEHIHLYAAIYEYTIIAGAIVYEYGQVIHLQYLAADDKAREIGALDLVIAEAIEKYRPTKLWLDFGKSTEDDGRFLNEGLISQKESFGGRTNVYETLEIIF